MENIQQIKVKTKWSEITILEYVQIMDILNSDADELDKITGVVSIITNLDIQEVLQMPIKTFQDISKLLEFIKEMPKVDLKPTYKIKDTYFTINYNLSKLTTQQYIDMLHLGEQDFNQNIHKMLSLFLIPSTYKKTLLGTSKYVPEKYGSYDLEEVADLLLNNLTIDIAHQLMVFFYQAYESLMSHTQAYLVKLSKQILKQSKVSKEQRSKVMAILRDGDGLQTWIKLLKELEGLGIKSGK